jgi:L-2,4-diaminobutyrate decarboxylase
MQTLQKAYDPDEFRQMGRQLVDFLAGQLEKSRSEDAGKVLNWNAPDEAFERWNKDLEDGPEKSVEDLFQKVYLDIIDLHNPRYMGHQISPPAPVAALAGMLGDFLNNGMGVYEMGIAGTILERLVVQQVAQALGFGENAGGFLTSGGTLANLTALLAARSIKSRDNIWQEGTQKQLALMVSEEAHYCVDRAVRIMGWGENGIIKVPADERFCMRVEELEPLYQKAVMEGKEVIAVVGSACSTSTGSFDDLNAIGNFCRRKGLWFHVDGAHGAAVAFSGKYRGMLHGIHLADSVAMDFHKMLLTPSITTALIFRESADSYRTFAQRADYLWSETVEPEWYNMAKRTFECTKLMMSLKVYAVIRTYGLELFDEYVTKVNDLGAAFGRLIGRRKDFELAVAPQCNIVCFRYLPEDVRQRDRLNETVRERILESGEFYIVQTRLRGEIWLRVTLTNPFTEEVHLNALLDRIAQYAGEISRPSFPPIL